MNSWARYVARLTRNENQVQIATKTGIDQGTISRWLNGKNRPRDTGPVARLAQTYGGNVLEAFVAAEMLTREEAGMPPLHAVDFAELVDDDDSLSANAKVHLKNQYGLLRAASAHARAEEFIDGIKNDPDLDDATRKRLLDSYLSTAPETTTIYASSAVVIERPFPTPVSADGDRPDVALAADPGDDAAGESESYNEP